MTLCVFVNDCVCSPLMELIAEAHLALLWIMLRFSHLQRRTEASKQGSCCFWVLPQDWVYADISVHLIEHTEASKILINRSFSQDYSCTECRLFQACFQTHEMTLNAIYVQGSHCGPFNVLTSHKNVWKIRVSFEDTVEFTMSLF